MNLEMLLALGLTEEVSKKILESYTNDISNAEKTAIENKNKILTEKKDLQALLESQNTELANFKAKQKEIEEKAKNDEVAQLFAMGEIDKAKELLKNNLLKDHQVSLEKYKTEVTQKEKDYLGQIEHRDAQIYDFMFDRDFQKIALENKQFIKTDGSLEMLKTLAKQDFKFEEGSFKFKDESALINGEQVTPDAWLNNTVKQKYSFMFEKAEGAGVQQSYGSNSSGKITDEEYDRMTTDQRAKAVEEGRI